MQIPIHSKNFRIATGVLVLLVLSSTVLWYWGCAPKLAVDDGTGEFLLVDAADRSLDGEPALALTFSLPLDSRRSYDKFIQVFEMPPATRPATNTQPNDEEDSD